MVLHGATEQRNSLATPEIALEFHRQRGIASDLHGDDCYGTAFLRERSGGMAETGYGIARQR